MPVWAFTVGIFFIVHFFITLSRSALGSTSPGTPVDLLCVCMCVQHVPSMFQAVSQTISQSVAFCRFLMLCLQHHHQKKISPLTIAWCVCRCSNQKFFLVFCSYFQFLFSIYCLYSIWLIHYNFFLLLCFPWCLRRGKESKRKRSRCRRNQMCA